MNSNNYKISFLIFLAIVVLGCSSSPRFTSEKKQIKPIVVVENKNQQEYFDNKKVLKSIEGLASYYADDFNGKVTANGETYKMYGLTAAHNSFPFNTLIRVTNLKNSRSVIVRVNDRMPLHPERLIDLSYGAAILLDMVKDGFVKVKLDILEWGK